MNKGSKMQWKADCGHSMVVYALEPTPQQCPDCYNAAYDLVRDWRSDIARARSLSRDCCIDNTEVWLEENGVELAPEIIVKLQEIAERVNEAYSDFEGAAVALWGYFKRCPQN